MKRQTLLHTNGIELYEHGESRELFLNASNRLTFIDERAVEKIIMALSSYRDSVRAESANKEKAPESHEEAKNKYGDVHE